MMASASTRRHAMLWATTALGTALGIAVAPAQELPTGGSVTHGAATISQSGASLIVEQAGGNAILSWDSFSVGGTASAHFANGDGATLNRVTGALPSAIDGQLTATGSLYLINPAGVAVGSGGMVRTGGSFVASTHDVSDADFLAGGDMVFRGESKASIVNEGVIASLGGDVVLTARRVENSGTILAEQGDVGLLAGYEVLLRDVATHEGKFAVRVGGADTEVLNTGRLHAVNAELRANGGNVYALAGNTQGVVTATGVARQGGRIFLTAGDGGTVRATQRIEARPAPRREARSDLPAAVPLPSARPTDAGGTVRIAAGGIEIGGAIDVSGDSVKGGTIIAVAKERLELTANARLDASGADGGTILLGGDWQGGGNAVTRLLAEDIDTTRTTHVAAGATIRADGSRGAGGTVVVWADGHTGFAGAISATGQARGGEAEVSGKATLAFGGTADLRSVGGGFGTLLLDPYDITISNGAQTTGAGFAATGENSVISATTLLAALGTANVRVTTGTSGSPGAQDGNIRVDATLAWDTNATLTLHAARNVVLDAGILARAGGLTLDAGGTITTGAGGTVEVARFTLANGAWTQNGASLPAFAAGDFRLAGGTFLRSLGGAGTSANPYMLADIYGVQGMSTHPAGHFALANDVDAAGTTHWWGGLGFSPIGLNGPSFTGSLDGRGRTISDLTIARPEQDNVGLFGATSAATITSLGLVGGAVSGRNNVGGLVGRQGGGSITQSYATGAVSGSSGVGGLVGLQFGNIAQSYAAGPVSSSGSGTSVGGLVGRQDGGDITQSYATGAVSGTQNVGGLVGLQSFGSTSSIVRSYATGAISGDFYVGGLVGQQFVGNSIAQSYATGAVSGSSGVGGLMGLQFGSIAQSYATGAASGSDDIGGLVGAQAGGSVSSSYWDTQTTGRANGVGRSDEGTFDATGLTTAEARSAAGYAGWDFGEVWYQAGDLRPMLRAFAAPAVDGVRTISNLYQLQLMGADLGGTYALTRDIDAAATNALAASSGIWGAGGLVPVGTDALRFTGALDGRGRTISGLTIARPGQNDVGLFGVTSNATITRLGLVGGAISGGSHVGGLVGRQSGGSIEQSYATGAVGGTNAVGGLVGWQRDGGSIARSYVTGAVNGRESIGGLAGLQSGGSIEQSYATGAVSGSSQVGGLAGLQGGGSIAQSFATGAVSGHYRVGGLVGHQNGGSIAQSYATGAVSGSESVGGLLGGQSGISSSIRQSYATGAVSGSGNNVGGLVGWQQRRGSVSASHWDTQTTGRANGLGGSSDGGAFDATGLTTAEARSAASYAGWDFGEVWYQAGDLRPMLRAFAAPEVDGVRTISNLYQLQLMGADLGGQYALARDIDASATNAVAASSGIWGAGGFVPVGTEFGQPFTGSLDGRGRTISGLTITRPEEDFVGLFRVTSNATITNLGLIGGTIRGGDFVGGLVGRQGSGSITQSYATGTVSGHDRVGGLVGGQSEGGSIEQSYATGAVSGHNRVGGLMGVLRGNIAQSYATGAVTGGNVVGGLVGEQGGGRIAQSYATGAVSGEATVGGLVGVKIFNGRIAQSYATGAVSGVRNVGGLVGVQRSGSVSASHWDTQTTGQANGRGLDGGSFDATGLTTAQAHSAASYAGWDFDTVWAPPSAGHYPTLRALSGGVVTVTASGSRAYGEADADSVIARYTGLRAGEFLTGAATVSGLPGRFADVGTYQVTSSGGASTNAGTRFVHLAGTQTITQRAITVTADDATRVYGDADPALGWTVGGAGLVNGDALTGALVSNADATSNVGAYAIGQGTLGASGNYALTFTGGTLDVTRRAITVAAGSGTSTYGDAAANPGFTATNLAAHDDLASLGGLSLGFDIGAQTDAGAYDLAVLGDLTNGNYTITQRSAGTWTVTPRAITVTADDATRVYGDADPAFGWTVGDLGLVNGDTLTGTLASNADATSNVGAYAIGQGNLAASANYALTFTGGTLDVTRRAITVAAGSGTSIYGDAAANPGFTATNLAAQDDLASLGGLSLGFGIGAQTDAGAYDLAVLGDLTNGNYTITQRSGGTWTVTPRAITVTADDATRIYGDANPTLGWTVGDLGLVNGDTLTGTLVSNADATSNVGAYAIGQGNLAASANYALTFTGGTLDVTRRAITVAAGSGISIYGEAATSPGFTATNLAAHDSLASLGGLSLGFGIDAQTDAGAYDLAVLGALDNYTITERRGGTWTVTPRAITVTADDATRIYGDANPTLGWTVGGAGLVNGDTLTGTLASNADATSNVGAYAIGQGNLAASANYALTFTGGTLDVTRRAITVAAGSGISIYGEAATSPGFTATNLAAHDNLASLGGLSLGFGIDGGTNVGAYGLAVLGDLTNANYTITQRSAGTWTVTPRAITVTANDATHVYGEANPEFGWTVGGAGLVNGDTLTGALATEALLRSGVGTYGIGRGTLAASANYEVSFLGGVLAVTPRAVTVAADNQSKAFGTADPALTWRVAGLASFDTAGSVFSGALSRQAGEDAGTYAIGLGSLVAGANYALSFTPARLVIAPAPVAPEPPAAPPAELVPTPDVPARPVMPMAPVAVVERSPTALPQTDGSDAERADEQDGETCVAGALAEGSCAGLVHPDNRGLAHVSFAR